MRVVLVLLALATPAHADTLAIDPAEADAIASRLLGQRVEIARDRAAIRIVDVAGEGAPRVGVVEREGEHLFLTTSAGRWRLEGPLARPRIAGPGYTVWVLGSVSGTTLVARRLGVLRRPALTSP